MTDRVRAGGMVLANLFALLGGLWVAYGVLHVLMEKPPFMEGNPLGPSAIGMAIMVVSGILSVTFGGPRLRRAGMWGLLGLIPGGLVFGGWRDSRDAGWWRWSRVLFHRRISDGYRDRGRPYLWGLWAISQIETSAAHQPVDRQKIGSPK